MSGFDPDSLLDDLIVQSEIIRGEGTWYYVEPLTAAGRAAVKADGDNESAFVGRGAKQKADVAYRRIVGLLSS